MSLVRSIFKHAFFSPSKTAIIDDKSSYSYLKLLLASWHMTRLIRQHTDKPNVGVMLPPSGGFPLALIGCWIAGRVCVPLNFLLKPEELACVIQDSGIDTIFTVGKLLDMIGGEDVIPEGIKVVKLEDLAKQGGFKGLPMPVMPHRFDKDDLAILLYTSGTSGRPKGVMLTHGNFDAEVDGIAKAAEGLKIDTFLGVLPQFHSFGCTALTLWPLTHGHQVIYTARFAPKKILELIRTHRPNVFAAVPSMYNALLTLKKASPEDFTSLTFPISGGEPLPKAVSDQLLSRFNLRLFEGYGLTETAPVANCNIPKAHRDNSVGQAIPGVRNMIVDDDGNRLPPNEDGEILIIGDTVMKGYYNLPEETATVFTQVKLAGQQIRAFKTGDIGHLDDDGYLYITGRKKEMLIVAGENVFPREIEEALNQHESIQASAVIGMQDETRGELPLAFVELVEGAEFDDKALRTFVRERLAGYKVPKEIRIIDELPRNPTGKIMRRELKA